MTWTVRTTREAERQLGAVAPPTRQRVANALARLAANPRGDVLVVLVLRVAHRREVYR